MTLVFYIIGAIVMIGVLVVVHELGHYCAGRALKLPIVEFSVGFGPLLFGRERNGIQYSLRALPFGGYCGFDEEANDGKPSFMQTAAWRRLVTFIAGPAMNIALAYLLAVVYLSTIGMAVVNVIAGVEEGMPAETAGVQAGDKILAVNGQETTAPIELIRENDGSVVLTLLREGERIDVPVEAFYDEELNVYRVGVSLTHSYVAYPLGQSILYGGTLCYDMLVSMFDFLGGLVMGRQNPDEVVGIVGTVTMISTQAQQGFEHSMQSGFANVLAMAIMISLNLGLINMLPLPAVDGGRIVFSLIEIVARRPVPQKVESMVHTVGFVLLFGLMLFLVVKDVVGLVKGTMPL